MSAEERRQNVINNPHLVDWFFSQRLERSLKHWLYETMDAEWHWYRFEYQHRGSIHCHGTAKLKNDPGLCKLTEIALAGFHAQRAQTETGDFHPDVNEIIDAGKNAERKVCQYVDWLLTTVSPFSSILGVAWGIMPHRVWTSLPIRICLNAIFQRN